MMGQALGSRGFVIAAYKLPWTAQSPQAPTARKVLGPILNVVRPGAIIVRISYPYLEEGTWIPSDFEPVGVKHLRSYVVDQEGKRILLQVFSKIDPWADFLLQIRERVASLAKDPTPENTADTYEAMIKIDSDVADRRELAWGRQDYNILKRELWET